MCNQIWSEIPTPSTVSVELTNDDGNAVIRGTLELRTPAGNTQITELERSDFPLHVPLTPGVECGVAVELLSTGGPGTVTVASRVSGAGQRGPDVCPLAVDGDHPVALATVLASAE